MPIDRDVAKTLANLTDRLNTGEREGAVKPLPEPINGQMAIDVSPAKPRRRRAGK